jgi:hypothetical protein
MLLRGIDKVKKQDYIDEAWKNNFQASRRAVSQGAITKERDIACGLT